MVVTYPADIAVPSVAEVWGLNPGTRFARLPDESRKRVSATIVPAAKNGNTVVKRPPRRHDSASHICKPKIATCLVTILYLESAE
jgi:hypothetical protein